MVCGALKGDIHSKIGSPGPSEGFPELCPPGKLLSPLNVSVSIHKIRTSADHLLGFLNSRYLFLLFTLLKTLRGMVRKLFAKI